MNRLSQSPTVIAADRRAARLPVLFAILAAVLFAACDPVVEPTPPPVIIDPAAESIAVLGSQAPDINGNIKVSRLNARREDGWLVLLRDNGSGAPGTEVLGHVAIDSGITTTLEVSLEKEVANGEKIWAMLHRDSGQVGKFESAAIDRPAVAKNGLEVIAPTIMRWLAGEDQILEDNTVTIDTVRTDVPAWLVIYASDLSGNPTVAIGRTHTSGGTVAGMRVQLDTAARVAVIDGDRLWAVLHYDMGTVGQFEPGIDIPMAFFSPIRYRFRISAAIEPLVQVPTQTVTNDQVLIPRVEATKVGWIVIRESKADGTANMSASIGRARVSIGVNTGIRVPLSRQIPADTKLWAVLHEDTGSLGKYEYTLAGVVDVPILAGGQPVATAFVVQ